MDSHDFAYHDPIPVWAPNRPNTPTSNFSSHSDDMTTDMASHDFEDDDSIPVLAKTVANTPIEDIASSSNSAEKVFAITELAEMICLKLDDGDTTPASSFSTAIITLFNLQRVSKTFKAAIESSKKLQRVMLLQRDSEDAPERWFGLDFLLRGSLGDSGFHPALSCVYDVGFPDGARWVDLYWKQYDVKAEDESESESPSDRERYMYSSPTLGTNAVNTAWGGRLLPVAALRRRFGAEASWRRMILTSKPQYVKIRLVAWTKKSREMAIWTYAHLAIIPSNETLGAVYETIQQALFNTEAKLNEVQEDLTRITEEVVEAWRGETEEKRLRSLEKLRIRKQEHDQAESCGVDRGLCTFCSAMFMSPYPYWEVVAEKLGHDAGECVRKCEQARRAS